MHNQFAAAVVVVVVSIVNFSAAIEMFFMAHAGYFPRGRPVETETLATPES